MPFFVGHHRTTEAGPIGLIIASTPGACAWATPLCPFLAKTGGSRWDLVARNFCSSSSSTQTVYMSFSTGVYFTRTTAGRNDWVSFSAGTNCTQGSACSPTCWGIFSPCSTKSSACSPESFSPGTTELNFQPHQSDIRSSLQQKAQTFSPSNAAALTRHYRPLLRMRQQPR